jgi:hypothetical protein
MKKIIISSDKAASELLSRLLTEDIHIQDVEFSNWPLYSLHVKGERYKSSLTPSLMRPLIELQKGLYKTASRAIYNDENSNRLTPVQRSEFEYVLTVEPGSTDAQSTWETIFEKIIKECVGKMSGKQVLILLLSAGLLYAGTSTATHYIDMIDKNNVLEQETKKDAAVALEHTKQMQILADVIKKYPAVKKTKDEAAEVQYQILKETSDADEVSLNGVVLSGDKVREITGTEREKSKAASFVEQFRILSVDTTDALRTKVKVRGKNTEFIAAFNDESLDSKSIKLLQKHLISREPVRLHIEGKKLGGKTIHARIVSVAPKVIVTKS